MCSTEADTRRDRRDKKRRRGKAGARGTATPAAAHGDGDESPGACAHAWVVVQCHSRVPIALSFMDMPATLRTLRGKQVGGVVWDGSTHVGGGGGDGVAHALLILFLGCPLLAPGAISSDASGISSLSSGSFDSNDDGSGGEDEDTFDTDMEVAAPATSEAATTPGHQGDTSRSVRRTCSIVSQRLASVYACPMSLTLDAYRDCLLAYPLRLCCGGPRTAAHDGTVTVRQGCHQ